MLHVYFLADPANARAIATLDPGRSAPDAFQVLGQEIYLHMPNGMARTQTNQRLLRFQALHHLHREKLGHRTQARRDDD